MNEILDNFEILVIGNKRKEILTTEFLNNVKHTVFYTQDYNISNEIITDDWVPESVKLGAYRCFRGHIDALKESKQENILVFEDDAVVINKDWLHIVRSSLSLLDKFEIVNLHFRSFREHSCEKMLHQNIEYLYPKKNVLLDSGKNQKTQPDKFYGVAALAYLINKRSLNKLFNYLFNGTPIDILLWKEFSFCFIRNSPFKHDRKKGSLVENRKIIK